MEKQKDFKNPEYYENRELSWLKFDGRVLNEARDKSIPLLERLKFVSITSSNLDEFFMVRVASLKDMVHANYKKKDIAGMTASEQLAAINEKTRELVGLQYSTYNRSLIPLLNKNHIYIVDEFEKAISLRVIDNYWMEHISTMSHLRDGIGLRGYANTSPLQAYTMEGYQLFDEMIAKINRDISIYLLKSEIRQNIERKQVAKNAITNDSKDHAKVQKKSTKVGRNDPCPCGSGKKYKNCCGK